MAMIRDSRQLLVAFRADASVEIGTGHVMRCLTLADALAADGAKCLFLCRLHEGHLFDLITARGHEAIALPARDNLPALASDLSLPAHAHWLRTDWASDAQDSREALRGTPVDWLIVDHYALGHNWELAMRPHCRHLMVIDDLADRPHDCDLLLDQNLGRLPEDYDNLLPPSAQTLVGPNYALLRPEFAALRAESLARRENPQLRHLLVTMGGVDKDNATGAILDALATCDLPTDLRITVVLGPHAPFLEQVQTQAEMMPRPTQVLAGVSDMARIMTEADFAIGAAGSTSWERCCLGLPTLTIILAENQQQAGEELAAKGAIWLVNKDRALELELRSIVHLFCNNPEQLKFASERAGGIVDGKGTERVSTFLSISG